MIDGIKIGTKIKTYLVAFIAISLWGSSYIWSDSLIRRDVPIEYFVFVRILIASIILLIYNVATGVSIKIHRKDLPIFILLSLCEPLIYFVCETYGIKLTESPTYSALIIASAPIFSIFAGYFFFKEKVTLINVMGILVCLTGLVMVTLSATTIGDKFVLGVLLLICAVFAEVGHASCTKKLGEKYQPSTIVMYQFIFGSFFLFPLFVARTYNNFDVELYSSWEVIKPILFLAILCSSLAFTLWVSAIKNLGLMKSSIFIAVIPIVTALLGFVLGTETISVLQWAGIAVACVGLSLSQLKKISKEDKKQ